MSGATSSTADAAVLHRDHASATTSRPPGRWGRAIATALILGAVVVGGGQLAEQPGSPVRDWLVRRHPAVLAIAARNPDHLPTTYTPGAPLSVPFTVTRTGGGARSTRWAAEFDPADGSPPIAGTSGVLHLGEQGSARARAVVEVPVAETGRLVVRLRGGQSIAVWLEPARG